MRFNMFLSPHLFFVLIFIFTSVICFSPIVEAANDTLSAADSLSINQTLISAAGKFELGFFNKGNPKRYYVGIRYKDIPLDDVYVWVANRDAPLFTTSCSMKFDNHGNLTILDDESNIKWSTNQTTAKNPVLQLLDSGNLVIRETDNRNPDHYLWQSFDHPTDTLLLGQKLGSNIKTGQNWFLTSWKGPDDPGSGQYSLKLDHHGAPELVLYQTGQIIHRSGPWAGLQFSGIPEMNSSESDLTYSLIKTSNEVYYTFQSPKDSTLKSRLMVNYDGLAKRLTWEAYAKQWITFWYEIKEHCDSYMACGPNSVCNNYVLFYCQCPQGFKPKNPAAWRSGERSGGCERNHSLECQSDGFVFLEDMKLPRSDNAFVNDSMSIDQCREKCTRECNCTAFANSRVVPGSKSGCITWNGSLEDMRDYPQSGERLYIRVAASDSGNNIIPKNSTGHNASKRKNLRIYLSIGISAFTAIVLLAIHFWIRRHKNRKLMQGHHRMTVNMNEIMTVESLQFDLNQLRAATQNFSLSNKLGEGGFGEVYKGVLENGQEIAVKRLSSGSNQGVIEFKNEILLVAKLQHKNLVRLLGFCLESNEKIIVYEYLRNSSLYRALFDSTRRLPLDWNIRFKIMVGIARGLLYLHEDSRLKIIHRDLKPSNILLDENMNPKISDFGLAKLFDVDQTQDNTKRIVGTYGYMAPEYAVTGHYSVKSDVYSFGIIVLEIVSNQKNRYFGESQQGEALLHRAWRFWDEQRASDLVDPTLYYDCPTEEVVRCIQIGLLCVQEKAFERPTMETIVAALSGQPVILSMPKPPSFLENSSHATTSTEISMHSGTEMITDLYPR